MELKRPLLAAKTTEADLQNFKYPGLVSPKIDGVRALVKGGIVYSRTMKPIPNRHVQKLFGHSALNGFDGELCVGDATAPDLMQKTMSGVMSIDGTPNAWYHVFDLWNVDQYYVTRNNILGGKAYGMQNVVTLLQTGVNSYEELLTYEQLYISLGYEGLMLRSLNGKYKQNRSTVREGILLKVKRFHDSEAIILDFEPLYRNTNSATLDERGYTKRSTCQEFKVADELLGSLRVRDLQSGVEFDVGSGFTEQQRRELWANKGILQGLTIKYKHFPATGVKDKPRFPIFLGFRDPRDL